MERIKTNNDLRGHGKPGNYGNMCVKLIKGRAFFQTKGGGCAEIIKSLKTTLKNLQQFKSNLA